MVDVNVTVSGIIMCCDESVCNVNLGRGYTIEKCPLDELPFKNAIMDGRNNLSIDYLTSRIIEDGKIYFICLKSMAKQDNYKKERTETALSFHFSDFGMRGYISMVKPSGLFLRFSFSFW